MEFVLSLLKKGMENIMPFTEMGVNHSQLTDSKDGNRNGKRLPFFKGTREGKTQRNFHLHS